VIGSSVRLFDVTASSVDTFGSSSAAAAAAAAGMLMCVQ